MYSAPSGYSDVADNPYRRESVSMSMGIDIDNTAADDLSSVTGGMLPMSNTNQLTNAIYALTTNYAVYEGYGIPTAASAGIVVPPITSSDEGTGVWSDVISDEEGNITWSFTVTLSDTHTSAVTLYTDEINITEGTAVFSDNGTEETVELTCLTGRAVASGEHTYDTVTFNITAIDSAYKHIRIPEIEFGDSVSVSIEQLTNQVTFIDEIDPLQIGMPMQELDFDLINVKGEYDEDNPNALYNRLAIGNPITLSYTMVSTGDRYTVPMGRFVIGEKSGRNNAVSIVAYDVRWKLLQMFNSWSIVQSEDLGTTLYNLLTSLDVGCSVDSSVNEVYPLADHTFDESTSVLDDIQRVVQAYGLTFLPNRAGTIEIGTTFNSDSFGVLPRNCQITFPEASQMSRYNFIDIGYGTGSSLLHYTLDLRPEAERSYTARSVLSINNSLIITEAQAIAVCNRVASRIYSKAVKVQWVSNPAMDLYDQVQVYSGWTISNPATYRPIKREITYDGMLVEETTFVS